MSTSLIHFVRDTLLLRTPTSESPSRDFQEEQSRWVGKFQQVTAPVMAKGVEDTAFYVYNRLLSLNEVGGNPEHFGWSAASLHRAFAGPAATLAVGAVLDHPPTTRSGAKTCGRVWTSCRKFPTSGRRAVARWSRLNSAHRALVDETLAPDNNEEYLLYQTLLGAWPVETPGNADYPAFVERIKAYLRKALQEAKVHTSWINPNAEYDEAVQGFVAKILDPEISAVFLEDLRLFQKRISHYGMLNSLGQTLVKLAAPGVPDFYQGTEIWDFSLVDPDNRRPVDYALRRRMLDDLLRKQSDSGTDFTALTDELGAAKEDGRIKLWLTCLGLRCRRDHGGLFTEGSYLPVQVTGQYAENVFSFARQKEASTARRRRASDTHQANWAGATARLGGLARYASQFARHHPWPEVAQRFHGTAPCLCRQRRRLHLKPGRASRSFSRGAAPCRVLSCRVLSGLWAPAPSWRSNAGLRRRSRPERRNRAG